MMTHWRLLAVGDLFSLPVMERELGIATIFKVVAIKNGQVQYRAERGGFTTHTCSLGWLIDNGLELF